MAAQSESRVWEDVVSLVGSASSQFAFPVCTRCSLRPCEWRPDRQKYRKICYRCRRPTKYDRRSVERAAVGKTVRDPVTTRKLRREAFKLGKVCERCGFEPTDPVQMDVDHRDGNRLNDQPSNWSVLCACCHRLKTKECRDHLNRYGVSNGK